MVEVSILRDVPFHVGRESGDGVGLIANAN